MFNANMPSLSDIAAVTGNDRDGGWGGNGWWLCCYSCYPG